SLKRDNTKPVTTVNVLPGKPDGTNEWYKSEVSFTLTASDEGSGVEKTEYRVNEGDWRTYDNLVMVKTDGIYKIEYRSIDKAGNVEESKSELLKLDKTNPVTTSKISQGEPNGANGWYTTDVNVELSANDGQSGISKTEYRVDGSDWAPYKSPIQLTIDGIHKVEYRSTDNAGNTEELKSINVKIDKTLPEVKLNLSHYTIWSPNHKMVKVTVKPDITDSISGFQSIVLTSITSSEPDEWLGDGSTELDIQNAEFGTADFEFDLRAERSGITQERIYTIIYTITDQAGNVRKVSTIIAVRHD
ncbi:OmpL47-type beta-barrel domain-containing protein, partial [Neobacillus drentensis]|uniref:OmpL47-type beta-barrel domain-containing protein n=1 Tax=Neobacillus drentensis TaxID=220684 RepID=UPI00302207FC